MASEQPVPPLNAPKGVVHVESYRIGCIDALVTAADALRVTDCETLDKRALREWLYQWATNIRGRADDE